MKSTKLIQPRLRLSTKSDAKMAEFASQCINGIGENATAFAAMKPTLVELTAAYNDFVEKLEDCGPNGNVARTSAKNQSRETLGNMLTWCAVSCSEIAGTDVALFDLTGFGIRSKPTRVTSVDCPTDLKSEFGPVEGSVYCSFTAAANARSYELAYGTTPADPSKWTMMYVSTSRRILLTDFAPMSKGYMRVRTIGPHGLISNWSNVLEFKVV